MDHILPIMTEDGSSSLLDQTLNETYHSTHGAIQESVHVFIKNGFQYFVEKENAKSISIFEVGFGTGLNALLSIQFSEENKLKTHYTTLEAFPIDWPTASKLNYVSQLKNENLGAYFQQIHQSDWGKEITISETFALQKIKINLLTLAINPNQFDVVFFDAFAPSKQPEIWALPILEKVIHSIKPKGVFVTYCAKGQLKRDLRSLGMRVDTLPGSLGKREMVRGIKFS